MPKHTDKEYYINNVPINIWNLIKYLCYLKTYGIIPEFSVSHDIDNLYIQTIYTDYNGKWNKNGVSLIKYNIYTKKWTSIIDHIKYAEIYEKYYYLIEYNMIKINYNHPYAEYELESDYFEDILEPSLNSFNNEYINEYRIPLNINPRNLYNDYNQLVFIVSSGIEELYNNLYNLIDPLILPFYQKYNEHEKYLKLESCKQLFTDNNLILPQEIWDNIYKLIIN
jgi:hypothetical protein